MILKSPLIPFIEYENNMSISNYVTIPAQILPYVLHARMHVKRGIH